MKYSRVRKPEGAGAFAFEFPSPQASARQVRASVMRRGRKLIGDKKYPSKSVINRLAEVLAVKINADRLPTPYFPFKRGI